MATMVVYVKINRLEALVWRLHPQAEPIIQLRAFWTYLKVSIPSALIVWSEWWAFEVLSVFVGQPFFPRFVQNCFSLLFFSEQKLFCFPFFSADHVFPVFKPFFLRSLRNCFASLVSFRVRIFFCVFFKPFWFRFSREKNDYVFCL